MEEFLNAPFQFPLVTEERPPTDVPAPLRGLEDPKALLIGNIALGAELNDANDKLQKAKEQLEREKERTARNQRERDAAKRKAENCDALRKKQKAANEQVISKKTI